MIQEAIIRYLRKHRQESLSPKAVLFDMDGVLYDSMRFHARAWHEVATLHQLTSRPEDFYMFEGRTGESTINELYQRTFQRDATAEEKQTIYKEKADLFNTYNDGAPMTGAAEVLKEVEASGLQRLVVTGSGQHSLIDKLNHTYPGHLMGLQKAHAKPNETFVVENAPMGVEAAVAANIFTIAVNTGPLPDQVLLDAGADLLYPDMENLAKDWKQIIELAKSTRLNEYSK